MTIAEDAVVQALNGYTFQNIWNEPLLEYASNVKLIPVSTTFLINWIIAPRYIPLPDTGLQYAVYSVNYTLVGNSLVIPQNTWVATDTIANTYQTLFHVYTADGLMLPKGFVLLYNNSYNNTLYVAIQKTPFMSIAGISNWSNLYLSVYRYLQNGTPLNVQSIYIPNPDTGLVVTGQVQTAITTALTLTNNGTTVYSNGYDIPTSTTPSFTAGSYVDIITDTTVAGIYSVNLTTTDTGYYSSFYSLYKQVLHCPKSLNPNNEIMTVELLSLTARRNLDNIGLYITKSAENSVTQITHNDVGINTEVVSALQAALGTQDISIEVKFRTHQKTLIREINYIDYLYINDDADILNFLIGSSDASLPFWTAASLEQATYVAYLSATPSLMSTQTLATYVQGLGYYTVLSILCQHLNNYPITSLPMSNLSIPKPLVLSGLPAYPVVYLNGIKVSDAQVGYSNTIRGNLLIGFASTVSYTTGQTISVDIIESGSSTPYLFSPISTSTTITVPFSTVQVYQLNTLTTDTSGYNVTSSVSCTLMSTASGESVQTYVSGTGTEVVFGPATYGNTYFIQNGTFSRTFPFDITTQVAAQTPIHVELTTLCTDGATTVPFVGYNSLDVYLNGNRLIPGIDFSAIPILDSNGNASIIQILICNMQFISIGNTNTIEVIARTGIVLENEIGYLANNLANIGNSVDFWYAGASAAFVGGLLQINPTDQGDAISPNPALPNAYPFYIVTEIPNIIDEVLTGYTSSTDDSRISLINTYFNNQAPENNISTLLIPESWKLYSPYLSAIYNEALTNTSFELFTNDPDDTLFLEQFSAWDYLKLNDPTVNPAISKIDLRYCDINPSYGTVSVPDTNTYTILQRLETLMLAADPDTEGDVVSG